MKFIPALVLSLVSFQALALDCVSPSQMVTGVPSICSFRGSHESVAGLFNGAEDLWRKTHNYGGLNIKEIQGTSWKLNSIAEVGNRSLHFDIPTEISFKLDTNDTYGYKRYNSQISDYEQIVGRALRADLKFNDGKSSIVRTNISSEIRGETLTDERSKYGFVEFDIPKDFIFSLREYGTGKLEKPRIFGSAYLGANNPELLFVPLRGVSGAHEVIAIYVRVKN
ncbi:hypothetical protein [Bdellovibrio bacteriovorus]|uniref:hypothetical protein n=1 Tax=Bdellovibrio TaxID=958 RepID=UPI0035A81A32